MQKFRLLVLDRAAVDNGSCKMAIASETPYVRWFGTEILGCTAAECDLTRLADGRHPLLLNHDTTKQVGVIDEVSLDPDCVLRGVARFSKSECGQEIMQDVADGIRTLVSVGYMVNEMTEMVADDTGAYVAKRTLPWAEFEAEQKALHGDDFYRAGVSPRRAADAEAAPVYRVTRWTPFEASLVAVPADVTVGVGRAAVEPQGETWKQEAPKPAAPIVNNITIIQQEKTMTDPVKIEGLDQETARRNAILDLGTQYEKYVGSKEVSDALRNGKSAEQFRDVIMAKMESKHSNTGDLDIGLQKKETRQYSFANLVRALAIGKEDPRALEKVGFELECSRALAAKLGRDPEGIFVPYEVMRRDFNVGSSTEAGNLVQTDLRTDLYVDALRASMALGKLNVRFLTGLTGNVTIPRKVTPSTLAGLTEIGSASETNPVTGQLTLSPKRVGAYVQVSKQALIQSALALDSMLRDDLVTGAAVLIENYAIQGSSAANGTGLIYRSGLGTVSEQTNGTNLIWDHLVDMETAAAAANAEPDRLSGYLANTQVRGKAKKVQRGTNLPFIWENSDMPLNGYRCAVTNNVPSNLTKGTSTTVASALLFGSDWSAMVLGFFGGVDVTVDPYSLAATGQVQITLNQFWDYTVRQPSAIVARKDILTA